jgi:hypothetical protein
MRFCSEGARAEGVEKGERDMDVVEADRQRWERLMADPNVEWIWTSMPLCGDGYSRGAELIVGYHKDPVFTFEMSRREPRRPRNFRWGATSKEQRKEWERKALVAFEETCSAQ